MAAFLNIEPGAWIGISFFAVWFFYLVNIVLAIKNVKPGVSRGQFLFFGLRVFDKQYFTERGQRYQANAGMGCVLLPVVLFVVIVLIAVS